jgi:hypothetical protein
MTENGGDHEHKTIGQVLEHHHDCKRCAQILSEQADAIRTTVATFQPQISAAVIQIQEQARRIGEVIRDQVSQVQAVLQSTLSPIDLKGIFEDFEIFSDGVKQMLQRSTRLGSLGWLIPPHATLDEALRLVIESDTFASSDASFADFFSRGDGENAKVLFLELLSHEHLTEWRPVLEEILFAFNAGRYRVCVPALLATFEGVAASHWTEHFDKQGGRRSFFKRKLATADPEGVAIFEWLTLQSFVETLFRSCDEVPLVLNRHWILHGRGIPEGNATDCLRLMLAIHAVADTTADLAS